MDNQGAGKGTATNKSLQGKAKFLWPRKKISKQFTFGISYPLFHWTTSPSYKTYLRGSHVNDGYWNKVRSDQHLLHRKSYYADKRESYQSSSHYIRLKHVQQSPSTTNARLESQNETHCTVTLFLPSGNLQAVKQLRWPRLRKPDLNSTKLVDLHPVERFKNLEWDELSWWVMFLHLDLSSRVLCLEIMTCPEAGCYHLQFTCCISGSNRFNMKLICRLEVNSFISLPDSQWLQSSAPLSWDRCMVGWVGGLLGTRWVA